MSVNIFDNDNNLIKTFNYNNRNERIFKSHYILNKVLNKAYKNYMVIDIDEFNVKILSEEQFNLYSKQLQKNYRLLNKDKIKLRQQKYRELNKDKIKEKQKKYRELNKDIIREKNKIRYRQNIDKIKQYRELHKEELSRKKKERSEERL